MAVTSKVFNLPEKCCAVYGALYHYDVVNTVMLLLPSGGACMPSHMEGWFYTLLGRETVPQDGHIR